MVKSTAHRAFRDMELPRLAQLLDTSAKLGACSNLATLGPTLFKILSETLPLRRMALWLEAPEPGQPEAQWAAELGADGILDPVTPIGEWVQLTRNLQGDIWDMENAEAKGCQGPLLPHLHATGFPAWVLLPLRTADHVVGGLALAAATPGAFRESGPGYLVYLARFVASFALRILRLGQLDDLNNRLAQERDQQRILLEITNELVEYRDPRDLFEALSSSLRRHLQYDVLTLILTEEGPGTARIQFTDFPTGRGLIRENQYVKVEGGPTHLAIQRRRPVLFGETDVAGFPDPIRKVFHGEGIVRLCVVPLIARSRVIGTLNFGSRKTDAFPLETLALLSRVTSQVALALDNAFAYQEIQTLKDKLAEEKLYLQEEIAKDFGMDIVGRSPSFQKALRQVETVAPSDATVLILGETGTGKELAARAIHQLSQRSAGAFVQINCAAIPMGLVESELFGYEKGAFTGALSAKAGRLELAHQGTLFLDEIGDLPLELQPKLLRAIQERQFERLGSSHTRKVDLRLITATHCDLAAMVEAHTFRADLYYRLNVFPIQLPPLRERKEDIPPLVRCFTQRFAQRMHKPIDTIPTRAMEALLAWDWPGNIRELENVIERSVILSPGRELKVPVGELRARETGEGEAPPTPSLTVSTLEDAEREHIRRALRAAHGKVGGPRGAAASLGLKRTTLQSRMLKLGITSQDG